jgi:hypothetical protein
MTFSDQLFTVIDRNVDAMIQAHELTHLDRSTAFNLLDSPDFIGLDTWDVLEYGQHWLHPAVMPIAERIPRSAWSLWYFRDWFCDLAFGGLPHGPETHTTVLGGGINLHHESGRFFYGEEWQGREADILPSLELRAEFLFRTVWIEANDGATGRHHKNGFYVFRPETEFLGIQLNVTGDLHREANGYHPESYNGHSRMGLGKNSGLNSEVRDRPETRAAEAYYASRGLPVGHAWLATL